MLIIGAYPKSVENSDKSSPINSTIKTINSLAPSESVIHLLPFCPSSGDFGFAPDNICQVDPSFGSLEDLYELTNTYRCVFDGIYNHVGNGHNWVKSFKNKPKQLSKLLHAYYSEKELNGPISPRGQPALHKTGNKTKGWYLWRTFTEYAVDIRLESPEVKKYIQAHLNFLYSLGAWGVRLDAVAYYKKNLDGEIRHNSGVNQIANEVAESAYNLGLSVFAQINRDEEGLKYFTDSRFSKVVINDFTFAAYLVLALLRSEPAFLVDYDRRCTDGRICIRAPRTHDGILLRSKAMPVEDKESLIDCITCLGIPIRVENGDPYELNCSLPFLLQNAFPDYGDRALELAIVITGMSSGLAYFYLPILLNYSPETNTNSQAKNEAYDPRELNREPITFNHLKKEKTKKWVVKCKMLLDTLSKIRANSDLPDQDFKTSMNTYDKNVLTSITEDGRYRLVANLSGEQISLPDSFLEGECLISNSSITSNLEPMQFYLNKLY